MARRLPPAGAFLASVCAIGLVVRASTAAPSDASATKVRDDAIYNDYLSTSYASAEAKLKSALVLCKDPADCSPAIRARLLCDLGVVQFMLQRAADGRAQFAAALKEDPTLTLDADLSTPELQREFAAAKGALAAAAGSASAASPGAAPAAPAATGDMTHTPVASQAVLTPVPVYVELPGGVTAARVYVRFKAPGATAWKTAPMAPLGAGYAVEIPCAEVGDSTGDLKYFVQAVDGSGDLLASSGRLVQPYTVRIVQRLEGEPPHVPGRPPPAACAAPTDCPPSFPGCHADAKTTACVSSDECGAGQTCTDGTCVDDHQPPERAPYKQNWLSVAFEEDAVLLPSAANACGGGTGYTCFSGGSYDSGVPLAGADDQVNGGITLSTSRILVGYDRALWENFTAGARLGYVLGGGPQRPGASSFMPVHAEVRGTYWFGDNPLARSGFRFFVLAAGGMAQVDASVPVDTYASTQAYMNQQSQNYTAWKKTGLGFVAAGGGAMFAITPSTGVALEAKVMEMFPTTATGFGAQLAYLVGL
jgi:hypothetical protein